MNELIQILKAKFYSLSIEKLMKILLVKNNTYSLSLTEAI